MKPYSQSTLEKKYKEANLSTEEIELFDRYLNCFSNLYGVIQIRNAVERLKEYEPDLKKIKFLRFVDIVQRAEKGYVIENLCDIFADKSSKTMDKLLINKDLINYGYGKYFDVENVAEYQLNQQYYFLPKEEFLKYENFDMFDCKEGKELIKMIDDMVSTGINFDRQTPIFDVNGNSIKGKKLTDFSVYFDLEEYMCRGNSRYAEKLKEIYSIPASQKLLNRIKHDAMVEIGRERFMIEDMPVFIENEIGYHFNEKTYNYFMERYHHLLTNTRSWALSGWSIHDFVKMEDMIDDIGEDALESLRQAIISGDHSDEVLDDIVTKHLKHKENKSKNFS